MSPVRAIAGITFKEGIRSRALMGLFILTVLLLLAIITISDLFIKEILSVTVDLTLSTISFSGLLLLLFTGINLLAKDLDKRTIYIVISRPISRPQYITGKFLGLLLIVLLAMAFLGFLGSASILLTRFITGTDESIHWFLYLWGVLSITLMLAVVASIIVFFSSFTSNTFITLTLTMAIYIIGQSIEEVRTIVTAGFRGKEANPALNILVEGVYRIFPNLSIFDFKANAAHGISLSYLNILWVILYGLLYITIIVSIASLIFKKKEFP